MKSCLSKILPTEYSLRNLRLNVYTYKQNLSFNNLQMLICHKTLKNNQPLVFGCDKFWTCIYGLPFIIKSSHKLLEIISRKKSRCTTSLSSTNVATLARVRQGHHVSTRKDMNLANGLPRLLNKEAIDLDMKVEFGNSKRKLTQIHPATRTDPILYKLRTIPSKMTLLETWD